MKAAVDTLVIGGGLAGSSAAIALAQAGHAVTLIEKERQPHHKVCGEFLSHEALTSLRGLGIDVIALGAVPIHSVRLAGRLGITEVTLPFPAMSLTRRKLDEELLLLAANAGTSVLRGQRVQKLERKTQGWNTVLDDGSTLTSQAVFQASGKQDLQGHARPPGPQCDLVAFKMYWRLAAKQTAELEGRVELCLYPGGYAGLQPVEDGIANLCCLVRRSQLQQLGGRWEALLQSMKEDCKHLGRRLAGAEPMLSRPLAASSIPYGFIREHSNELWHIGDQAAVIPSFTGDGMSIALHSGCLAAKMYCQRASPQTFQKVLHEQLARQVPFATFLSRCLVAQPQQTLMEAIVRLWPGGLKLAAKRTRLQDRPRNGK